MVHATRPLAAALLFALLGTATAQEPAVAPAAPTAPAAPAAPVAPVAPAASPVDAFTAALEADREKLRIPGLSYAIVQDGAILRDGGLGFADVEAKVRATADTPYPVASLTKTFTAVLALRLAEKGKLKLDAPVKQWVTTITDERVQVRHLLSHTSEGTPGDSFHYNPDRFEHLRAVLEGAGGKPLRLQVVENILTPLAMNDSVPGPDIVDHPEQLPKLKDADLARYRATMSRIAQPYTMYGDGEILRTSQPPADYWASSGLISTVRDLAKFSTALDRHELLGAEMEDRMWTPFTSNAGQPLAQGLGWYVTDYYGEKLVWHFGHWGTGYSAMVLKIPARNLALIVLANSEALADHHYQAGEDITHNVIACDFINAFVPAAASAGAAAGGAGPLRASTTGPSPDCARTSRYAVDRWLADRKAKARAIVPLEPALASAYAGRYQFPGRVVTISDEGGRLFVDFPAGVRSEIFATSPTDLFVKVRPWTMTAVREGDKVVRFDINEAGSIYQAARVE